MPSVNVVDSKWNNRLFLLPCSHLTMLLTNIINCNELNLCVADIYHNEHHKIIWRKCCKNILLRLKHAIIWKYENFEIINCCYFKLYHIFKVIAMLFLSRLKGVFEAVMATLSETFGWAGFDGIPSNFTDDFPVRLEVYCSQYLQFGMCGAMLKILREFISS